MTSLLCANFMHKIDQLSITYLEVLHLHMPMPPNKTLVTGRCCS